MAMDVDTNELLKVEKRSGHESFSQIACRLTSERPALTANDLQVVLRHLLYNPRSSK
jgi:hypothetical protein